jgi:predicted enzyme related to lactoylglutathione lyase
MGKSIKEEKQIEFGVEYMPNIVHFEVPFEDGERARKFYAELFGWKIVSYPGMEYWMVQTFGGPGGGMMKRVQPGQQIMNYFGVPSLQESSAKVETLGGKIIVPKMTVPGMGYFVVCMDTEGNVFGLWEEDSQAK